MKRSASSVSDVETEAAVLRRRLADCLTGADDPWHDAFQQVPRHRLLEVLTVYDHIWRIPEHLSREWLAYVYSDADLVSRLDDQGHAVPLTTRPSDLVTMLHALDTREGDRVLHIGTGTGYAPALLAHRLGSRRVTTVEITPQRSLHAWRAITGIGYHPHVVTGDGHAGALADAPFHRVMATGRPAWLPPAWVRQTVDGGLIVTPFGRGIAQLRVDGDQARGRFLPAHADMPPMVTLTAPAPPPPEAAVRASVPDRTGMDVNRLVTDLAIPLSFVLPDQTLHVTRDDSEGEVTTVRLCTRDGSALLVDASGAVWQSGPRRLWPIVAELDDLFPVPPSPENFGISITPERQWVWYRVPDGPSWPLHPPAAGHS
jgi:protein-L-isoaspartate O-methyltransferase